MDEGNDRLGMSFNDALEFIKQWPCVTTNDIAADNVGAPERYPVGSTKRVESHFGLILGGPGRPPQLSEKTVNHQHFAKFLTMWVRNSVRTGGGRGVGSP